MTNSKTKKMILNAILLGIGVILHQVFPAIAGGITPDLTLVMLFCIMIINRDDYKTCFVAGLVTGLFTAFTTKFPMGQIPNVIDKIVTVNVMYLVMKVLYVSPFLSSLKEKKNQIIVVIMTIIGTIVSGVTFLYAALLMAGLPSTLTSLFIAVVLPSVVINIVAAIVLFNIIKASLKRTSYQIG